MLSVTSFITSDIASAPLLWVIPLALYLVTFILSFANKKLISIDRSDKVTRILLAPLVLAIATKTSSPMAILVPLHLVAFLPWHSYATSDLLNLALLLRGSPLSIYACQSGALWAASSTPFSRLFFLIASPNTASRLSSARRWPSGMSS